MRFLFVFILLFHGFDIEAIETKSQLKILYTAALIPQDFELRKAEYICSLAILNQMGYGNHVYVAHVGGDTPLSFFEQFCDHVIHTNTNDYRHWNKGVNEAKAMQKALKIFNFDDEDVVLKLTGRYWFNDDYVLKYIEDHPEYDVFVYQLPLSPHMVSAGAFAMRCRYFKEFLQQLDLERMESRLISIEEEIQAYLKKLIAKGGVIAYLDTLHLTMVYSDCVKYY